MSASLLLALLLAASHAIPPADEAEAYRLDALQTQALNRRALSTIERPPAVAPIAEPAAPALPPRDEQVRRRLEDAMQRWRERVAACRAGDASSCDR